MHIVFGDELITDEALPGMKEKKWIHEDSVGDRCHVNVYIKRSKLSSYALFSFLGCGMYFVFNLPGHEFIK